MTLSHDDSTINIIVVIIYLRLKFESGSAGFLSVLEQNCRLTEDL